jgi:LysR family transcriptional regulator, flagellar master operon regulator
MNITLAKTFLAVLEHRNFNRAGEVLNVTQSTVTMRINSLEEQIGQKLFIRSRAGVEPTAVGWNFRRYSEMLIQIWQQARQELTLPVDRSTRFKIGAEPELWQGLMEDWVIGISQKKKDLSLLIETKTAEVLNSCLAQGLYDAAILYDARPRTNIALHFLYEEHLVLVSTTPRVRSNWHPEYIYVEWGQDFRIEHAKLQPEGLTPPITINQGSWALSWIERQGGSAYFPTRMVEQKVELGKLYVVPGVPSLSRSVWVSYQERLKESDWFPQILQDLRDMASATADRDEALRKRWKVR